VFYNDLTNQQLQAGFQSSTDLSVPFTTGILNAGKSRMWGVEVDASLSPVDILRLDANYAYLNTKLQSASPAVAPAGSPYDLISYTSIVGQPLPFTPKHKLSLTATLSLPIPENLGKLSIGANYIYSSSYQTSSNALGQSVGKSNIVNLNLNWNSVGGLPFDLTAFATNVTNEQYATFVIGTYDLLGFESRTLGEPSMYGVRLKWRFGASAEER
jgi:iron complex outermembrane receptor protein